PPPPPPLFPYTTLFRSQSVMHGVVPATAGITALVGLNNLLPLMRKSSKEGIVYVLISCALILACAIAIVFAKITVAVVVLSAVLDRKSTRLNSSHVAIS